MRKSDFIKRAWSFIDQPRKWIRGSEKQGNTYCSVGALKAAYRALELEGVPRDELMKVYIEVTRALEQDARMPIISYNDNGNYTTVSAWWQRVIDRLSREDPPPVKVELKPEPAFLKEQQPKVVHAPQSQPQPAERKKELA